MKTATFPSLRVSPELRQSAESVLQEGETLSSFVAQAIHNSIEYRKTEQAFIQRGLKARDKARQTGQYVDADKVVGRMQDMLHSAKTAPKD